MLPLPPSPQPDRSSDLPVDGTSQNEQQIPSQLAKQLVTKENQTAALATNDLDEPLQEWSPWLVSFLVHFTALFLLGLITYSSVPGRPGLQLIASSDESAENADIHLQRDVKIEADRHPGILQEEAGPQIVKIDVPLTPPLKPSFPAGSSKLKPAASSVKPLQESTTATRSTAPEARFVSGGGLEGRDSKARATLAGSRGGNRASEAAVEKGLRWLVAHQRENGGWCFDLKNTSCQGQCRNVGSHTSTTAATALALLPFLGAGYTQRQGEHSDVVQRGLRYLASRAVKTPRGADLQEGTMYAQGIATLALCEAYAMTQDENLKELSQQAINFIVFAQDLGGGGWRYTPGTPGDTTVSGWQTMALRSGSLARLDVPSPTIGLIQKFLDSVQFDGGAQYYYMLDAPPRHTHTTTAVGLLCRMYLGWKRDHPALYKGVAYLHKWGPSKTDMYYNYYATQVLHHWGGPEWETWNRRMRDYLVKTQAQEGHEAGSWHFEDPYGNEGGRLYNTCLAILTLEVYYRYSPIYGTSAVDQQF